MHDKNVDSDEVHRNIREAVKNRPPITDEDVARVQEHFKARAANRQKTPQELDKQQDRELQREGNRIASCGNKIAIAGILVPIGIAVISWIISRFCGWFW